MLPNELSEIVDRLRLAKNDSHDVEAKAAVGGLPTRMAETVSAFANGNGGTIILGLSEADGFTVSKDFKSRPIFDALSALCSDKLQPPARAEIQVLPFEGGEVVVAQIPAIAPQDRPCYIKSQNRYGGSYIRSGDGNRKLSPYEIDRLLENQTQPLWDLEIVENASLEDLNQEAVKQVIARERQLHPRIFSSSDETTALRKLRVIGAGKGDQLHPTLAGLLALGDYPQEFFPRLTITYAIYSGASKAALPSKPRFEDTGTLVGPIPELVTEGVHVVSRNMRVGGIVEGAFRQDLADYPLVAVREALTNALMHRDYSPQGRGTQVQLNIFVDRLEILNPGGLFGTVTLENLGTDGISSTRNQYLSRLLEVTAFPGGGFVAENRGSGYQEIMTQLERDMLPPPIPKDSLTGFSLTFERRRMTKAERRSSQGATSRDQILNYLLTHSSANSRELAAAAGVSVGAARNAVSSLVAEGIVERLEPARSPKQRYRLLSPSN
ncbi:MAG: ATP-binding protein [Ancrocorticia sp.]